MPDGANNTIKAGVKMANMTYSRIEKLQMFLIEKVNITKKELIKARVNFKGGEFGTLIYDKCQVWDLFKKNNKLNKELKRNNILTIVELEASYEANIKK